ncbi:type II toxin-antitoxin system Phd/YefM family antitoxin [Cellulomonas timonensis]|uniref:type II toxin-antitoxin system Phd/YefM family antitoxin n=1 Tax=Cellulomonas timonensis TaxID=1689271 RepID=UPI00082A2813|nr:type II toxin-antitoxin system prevent-host-death family antitoxin [Cellulomonas timonensis]
METVGVRELRQDASGVLRRVEEGERVVVTVHGRPVADLVQHAETRPTWRPVRDLAPLFPGVQDPHWDQDMTLVDGDITDPFERGADR